MPYARQYTLQEIKGRLQISEGNRIVTGVTVQPGGQVTPTAFGSVEAHAGMHAGASLLDQTARVNTPGQPRTTGTYWSTDDQAAATLEVLNSPTGQAGLAQLDGAAREAFIGPVALTPNRYRMAVAHDDSDLGANVPGHVGRNSAARTGAGATEVVQFAATGSVKIIRLPGGMFIIQTSFPS